MPGRIVSGGQTGVDRAALDVALAHRIPCGGWCPAGRRAEDGIIDARYPLEETKSRAYRVRTFRNVRDSDATLILTWGAPTGGTRLTVDFAERLGRPVLVLDLDTEKTAAALKRARRWLAEVGPGTLNVAGPRESKRAGAHDHSRRLLERLLIAS